MVALCVFFSMAPDLDFVVALFTRDIYGYHNQASHSIWVGLVVCLLATACMHRWLQGIGPARLFVVLSLCYQLHLVMDWMTRGRGVMLFWPFTSERYSSPVLLFYGVRWSEGLFSVRHGITLLNELLFVVLLILLACRRRCDERDRGCRMNL